jgi:hypothetical protein
MNSSKTFFDYKKDKIDKIMDSDVIEQSTKEKINTIFRFYRFFIESNTIEHKFLNLWI